MSFAYVQRAYVSVDGQEIADVEKVTAAPQMDVKAVKTMNRRNRPRGFTAGQPHWELGLTVKVPLAGEFDWEQSMLDGKELSVVLDEDGVNQTIYAPCRVSGVDSSYDNNGETVRDVKLIALDRTRS
jgi:hypothetical protein